MIARSAGVNAPGYEGILTPSQLRKAYGIDSIQIGSIVGDGTGQTIAIIDAYHYPTALYDLQQFDAAFGLPDLVAWSSSGNTEPYLRIVDQTGGTNYPAIADRKQGGKNDYSNEKPCNRKTN